MPWKWRLPPSSRSSTTASGCPSTSAVAISARVDASCTRYSNSRPSASLPRRLRNSSTSGPSEDVTVTGRLAWVGCIIAIAYGTCVLTVPEVVNWITPPQLHMHFDTLSRVGMFASSTVGAPGTQGAAVAGMQGIGVNTPMAAAVAAATVGLAGDMQTPKGMILTIGIWSMILAAGGPSHSTLFFGSTTSDDGAAPIVQVIMAPMETWFGISTFHLKPDNKAIEPGRSLDNAAQPRGTENPLRRHKRHPRWRPVPACRTLHLVEDRRVIEFAQYVAPLRLVLTVVERDNIQSF